MAIARIATTSGQTGGLAKTPPPRGSAGHEAENP